MDPRAKWFFTQTILVSTVANVLLPSVNDVSRMSERDRPLSSVVGVSIAGEEAVNEISYVVLMVLSGNYEFKTPWTRTKIVLSTYLYRIMPHA